LAAADGDVVDVGACGACGAAASDGVACLASWAACCENAYVADLLGLAWDDNEDVAAVAGSDFYLKGL